MKISRGNRKMIRANEDAAMETADLLFEAEDVADLVAEVTGEEVTVEANPDGDSVTFTVGEDEYTVEAEGDEEVVESSTRMLRSRKPVKASTARGRVIRKMPRR